MRLWSSCDTGSKEIGIPRPDVTSKSESTSQYGPAKKVMLEELQRRNFAQTTVQYYLKAVEDFAVHFGKPPDQLNADHLRQYQVYLLNERKLPHHADGALLHGHAES